MFILCSISSNLEFWLVDHTSVNGNSGLEVYKNIFLGKISNKWPKDLLGANLYKTLESCW